MAELFAKRRKCAKALPRRPIRPLAKLFGRQAADALLIRPELA